MRDVRIFIGHGIPRLDAFDCATFNFFKYLCNCTSVDATPHSFVVFANPKLIRASAKSMDFYFSK